MPLYFNVNGQKPNGFLPKTSFGLAAERLSCALPRVPHFGISVSRKNMLADIFASPRPAASFIPFREPLVALTFLTSILLLSLLTQVSREEE